MPRTRSLAWSELKIGVLTIIAVGITVLTIFMLTGSRGFFWDRYKLKTQFTSVAGLKSGSPVMVAGVETGTVTDVELIGEMVDVTFEVNEDMRDRITSASRATLGSVSLLGGASVEITPALRGSPIPEWGYVPAGPAPAQFSDLATQANEGVQKISALVEDIRGGKGTVGKLMTDEQLYREMTGFMASAGAMTRGLQDGRGTLGRLINDPKVATSLEASLKSVEEMTRRLNAGEGSLGKLMNDDAFSRTLTQATNNLKDLTGTLNQVSGRLDRGEGTAGKLLTDPALFNRLNSTSERFDQLVARLNEGQGTVGQLLKDRQLYENMNGAVSDLRTLVAEIRKDPKKYLNVKISIF
jgi:phospholipid/cholesterol/gamma-HCH transport system substrate-binding protein